MSGRLDRDSAHYRIGPLTTYADPAELGAWHRVASVGAEMTYAIGPALGASAATAKLARSLSDAGEALLFLRRVEGQVHYIIRKRERAAAGLPRSVAASVPPGPQRQLYDALCALATDGLPLPCLEELAELARLSDRKAAHYRLNQLSTAGVVRVATVDGARVVEIVSTGLRTARPMAVGVR